MNPERLQLYYPSRPYALKQGFGANPAYYAKFHDEQGNPLRGHDGLDFQAAHGIPVHAAHDGIAHFYRDPHGGEGVSIHTTQRYAHPSGGAFYITMHHHLVGDTEPSKYPPPIATDGKGYPVKAGDLIGYADNTGAPYESSGDHLHFGLFAVDERENTLDIGNGYDGRIDPDPFFSGIYADTLYTPPQAFQHTFTMQLTFNGTNNDPGEVRALQQALQALTGRDGARYMPAGAFGPFGPLTKAALGKFQTDHGIHDVDGQGSDFGPASRAAINAALLNNK